MNFVKINGRLINLEHVTSIIPRKGGLAVISTVRPHECFEVLAPELDRVLSEKGLPNLSDVPGWPELPDDPKEWGLDSEPKKD